MWRCTFAVAFLFAAAPCLALTADEAGAIARRVVAGEAAARAALLEYVARRDAEAEFALAQLVFEGRAFTPDAGQARRLAERAALRGLAGAQNMFGFLWQHGLGGERDLTEARRWYEQAANAGDANAQVNLGWLYQQGLGVDPDLARAAQWYEKAAASGSAAAMTNLGALNEGQLRHAGAAADWYEKAAATGVPVAAYRLGRMIEAGNGRRADAAQALVYYLKAAAAGIVEAQFAAALLLDSATAGPRRPAQALGWFEAALMSPNAGTSDGTSGLDAASKAEASYRAGLLRLSPAAGRPDAAAALAHFRAAAQLKHPAAMLRYAQALERGEGQRADAAQALEWYRRSAELGDAEALFSVGRFYEAGLGTPSDARQAMQYFSKAADKGHAGAKEMLNSVFGPPPDPSSRDRAFGVPAPFGLPSTSPR